VFIDETLGRVRVSVNDDCGLMDDSWIGHGFLVSGWCMALSIICESQNAQLVVNNAVATTSRLFIENTILS
jgi:hypothetical protein